MARAPTPMGKALRKLRVDSGERIFDLAKALDYTTSFVSALELGKKAIPDDFADKVIRHYKLKGADAESFRRDVRLSAQSVKVAMADKSDLSRELAVAFARSFPTLDDKKAKELLDALEGL